MPKRGNSFHSNQSIKVAKGGVAHVTNFDFGGSARSLEDQRRLYREHVIRQFSEVSLSGFGGPGIHAEVESKASLASIFIELEVRSHQSRKNSDSEKPNGSPSDPESSNALGRLGEQHENRIPALQQMASARRLVILGAPGSGKTTLLKFFSLCLAQHEHQTKSKEWGTHLDLWPKSERSLLPIFVELRQFAGWMMQEPKSQLPNIDGGKHLVDYINTQLKPAPLDQCSGCLVEALSSGKAIVFFDGLDEVPDNDPLRRFVLSSIESFASGPYAACRVVVTCRPRSYEDEKWRLRDLGVRPTPKGAPDSFIGFFEIVSVLELTDPAIDRFIERFYEEVGRRDSSAKSNIENRVTKLKSAVRRPELAELARNPLMLTIMSWLHRSKELPHKRAEILDLLVNQLLLEYERAKQRDDSHAELPKLSRLLEEKKCSENSLRRVLSRLAFRAHQSKRGKGKTPGSTNISKSELLEEFKNLPNSSDFSESTRENWSLSILQVIDYRTGLLVPQGGDWYSMPYKLQEFLAGEHLTDRYALESLGEEFKLPPRQCHYPQVVSQLIGDDGYWEEVVKWSAGIQTHVKKEISCAADLAEELVTPSTRLVPSVEVRRAIVAGEILWEADPNEVARSHPKRGPACLSLVRTKLDQLASYEVSAGDLSPKQRASAAAARGWLDELPSGKGLKRVGDVQVPDFSWCGADPKNPGKPFPSGSFRMGGDPETYGSSRIPFECTRIKNSFWMSRYPVTVAQFQAFVDAGGYRCDELWTTSGIEWRDGNANTKSWDDFFKDRYRNEKFPISRPHNFPTVFHTPHHPQIGISWFEASAFCAWLNSLEIHEHWESGFGTTPNRRLQIRMPTDAEWEFAARWDAANQRSDQRQFPWGSAAEDLATVCNSREAHIEATSAVGLFPKGASSSGIQDLAGNVWEWCLSRWVSIKDSKAQSKYNGDRTLDTLEGSATRVLRGGSWYNINPDRLRVCHRSYDVPGARSNDIGFRVVGVVSGSVR